MKKISFFFVIIILITVFFNFFPYKNIKWNNIEDIDMKKLETGDIIILNRKPDFYSIFGHSAIYVKEFRKMVEYPKIGASSFSIPFKEWVSEEPDRKAIVLRLKNINPIKRRKILNQILNSRNKRYKVVLNKKDNSGYYCSQWVWNVFYNSLSIDLDSNGGFFVMPYDFLLSRKVKILEF